MSDQVTLAKKLPSGSWRVQVYAGKNTEGKPQYRSFTRPTKKEAEYEALQWQLHYKEVSRDSTSMTLGEAMDKYIASKDGILSPSTLRSYDAIRRTALQELMPVKLNRLTPQMVQEAINTASKPYTDSRGRNRQRTPKTIRNIHGLLSAVLAEYHPNLQLHTTLPQKEKKEQTTTDHVVNIKGGGLYKRLKTILRKNDLPDIRFHDLRHTAASVMLLLNIPDLYAQRRGGWASNHTMKAVYQHLMDSKRNAVDEVIDEYFYELMKNAGNTPQNV